MSNWYSTGEDADKAIEEEKERRASQSDRLFRHWMPVNASQHVTFVDDEKSPHGYDSPFVFKEHQLHLNGSWKNWYTCIDGLPILDDEGKPTKGKDGKVRRYECPLCKGGDKPSLVAAYTIIDHNVWKDKQGNEHKDELKLFVCKTAVMGVLKKAALKKKGLRGWKVEVTRTNDKAPSTGDSFDFEERVTLDSKIVAPDYREVFKPKSYEDLCKVAGVSSNDSNGFSDAQEEDEIRF